MEEILTYTAFEESKILAHGPLDEVALKVKKKIGKSASANILVFSDSTGKIMDLDLRGSEKDVLERLKVFLSPEEENTLTGPGRPKLGVVSREVSLLPRHWEWLATQQGGASATLRKLVEEARKKSEGKDSIKAVQERAHKFMTSMAGDLPNYEEALRALYKKDRKMFLAQIENWPADIHKYVLKMTKPIFE